MQQLKLTSFQKLTAVEDPARALVEEQAPADGDSPAEQPARAVGPPQLPAA